ncbi:Ni/Fe-hydrogenase, b-type cytochrome subunit [Crenobacter caeni]|uniref:Ni/Fe-hydrogenase, b-type cytochrome subunit n=1 Tax=Crenobacter caeni TaxID=2705474 RepID=A0A6B2KV19_9NEIS|nr:Ni/Fe-hydrogenase, b-type cytochrome subunit [Crenobacter caeni]NDV13988.1 Ni/Fe-hydrogenase, b-type cytochrome subunit [Crenobacter caeni]
MDKDVKSYGFDGSAPQGIGRKVTSVYVYEAPVRLWHWVTVLCIIVLSVSGYLIGAPLPSSPHYHFVLGYIRFAHFAAGYILAVGLIGRLYWALVGNHHAREIILVPVWDKAWWSEFFFEIRWYLFLERYPKKYIGHNPVGQIAMASFLWAALFMCASGFALYGEGLGAGSWADTAFGWMLPLFGGSLDLHAWHRLGMWAIIVFVMIHVYAAIREDIMSKQSMVSTMISGFRMFKD